LFLANGELVGVCLGYAELVQGRPMGVFASGESIRNLILDHNLTPVLASSLRRRAGLERRRSSRSSDVPARTHIPAAVTPSGVVGGDHK
jgi:hypothetical protein